MRPAAALQGRLPRSPSFAVLEQQPHVTVEELITTLSNYADGGSAILARVVIALIDRVGSLSSDQERLLFDACQRGARTQRELFHRKEVVEYAAVMQRLQALRSTP